MNMPGESRFVDVNGIRTRYVVAGEGAPLLLLHGLGASAVTWRDNIGPLSQAYRVYAPDLPGHGDTDKPDIDYMPETILGFVVRFAESLGLRQPGIVGNSVGGGLGLMMALRHPELVGSLVLVDSTCLGREVSPYVRLVSIPGLGELLESSKVGGTRFMLYKAFHDRSFVTQELVEELYRSRQMPGAKEAVVRAVRNGIGLRGMRRKYVLVGELDRLRVPLMIVWGAQDQIVPVSHAYRASQAAPQARLQVFDQCGHWPHMEKASAFNAAVLDFLSRAQSAIVPERRRT